MSWLDAHRKDKPAAAASGTGTTRITVPVVAPAGEAAAAPVAAPPPALAPTPGGGQRIELPSGFRPPGVPAKPVDLPGVPVETGRSSFGSSYYSAWQGCKRAWAYNEHNRARGIEPPMTGGDPRVLGTAFHAAMASFYMRRMGRTVAAPLDALHAVLNANHAPNDIRERGEAMVRSYVHKYGDEEIEIVAIEQEFRIEYGPEHGGINPDPTPVPFTLRIDAAFRLNRKVWVADYKTGAFPTGASRLSYALSHQFTGLVDMGRRVWGADFGGLYIIEARSTPPFTVMRAPVQVPARALVDFPRSIRDAAADIARYRAAYGDNPELYPRTQRTTTCRTFYSQETTLLGARTRGWCDHIIPCYGVVP